MSQPIWLRDSITRRFALAIAAATATAVIFNILVDIFLGSPAPLPPMEADLFDRLPSIVRTMEAAPEDRRNSLAQAASTRSVRVGWSKTDPARRVAPDGTKTDGGTLIAPLDDDTWLVFTPLLPMTSRLPNWWALRVGIMFASVLAVSLLGASRLARPINAFAAAAHRFGTDPNASPMAKQGPAEMQVAIAAFNAMQYRVQRFVSGQAAMFAAISHDLRTPLTRMRLRGEFIEDRDQQARLFRDVDEMQVMVDSALMFLRDNAAAETKTTLDLAELLRSIADDYADIGSDVTYSGPEHLAFHGRPVGLRRSFGNLVDNAVKYGVQPTIDVTFSASEIRIVVIDHGPGIPADALEEVFAPFQRLETQLNRQTRGIGLGLASARAGFRAHGGEVVLSNVTTGGLCATVTLPLPPGPATA